MLRQSAPIAFSLQLLMHMELEQQRHCSSESPRETVTYLGGFKAADKYAIDYFTTEVQTRGRGALELVRHMFQLQRREQGFKKSTATVLYKDNRRNREKKCCPCEWVFLNGTHSTCILLLYFVSLIPFSVELMQSSSVPVCKSDQHSFAIEQPSTCCATTREHNTSRSFRECGPRTGERFLFRNCGNETD